MENNKNNNTSYQEQMRRAKEHNRRRQNIERGMEQLKHEVSEELMGTKNNKKKNDSEPITYAGNVGGNLTKRLVEMGEDIIINKNDINKD